MNEHCNLSTESELIMLDTQPQTSMVGKWLALAGTLILFSLPIGIILTAISMIELYESLRVNGVGDSKLISEGISTALVSTIIGLAVASLGSILLCISIISFKHRRPWVYRSSLTSAFLL